MEDKLNQDDEIQLQLKNETVICELCKKEIAKISLAQHWIEECEQFHKELA